MDSANGVLTALVVLQLFATIWLLFERKRISDKLDALQSFTIHLANEGRPDI
jgi:hypothetical protein